jgi:hypothetical protein
VPRAEKTAEMTDVYWNLHRDCFSVRVPARPKMAATNKCLAQSDKTARQSEIRGRSNLQATPFRASGQVSLLESRRDAQANNAIIYLPIQQPASAMAG